MASALTRSFLRCHQQDLRLLARYKGNDVHWTRIKKEIHSVRTLFYRSGLVSKPPLRVWCMSSVLNRSLSTTPTFYQKNNDNNKQKKDDDEEESKASLLAKALLWMMTAYIVITIMSLIFPSTNQPEVMRYVSWHEFLHHMLAKGEVQELIVRPELDLVTIQLQEDAVIKGRRLEHRTFHMNVVDVEKFEERLREAEDKLNIRPDQRVPVVYERNQESAWLLLFALVAVAFLILTMFRTGQIKTPSPMDIFSQLGRAKFTIIDPHTSTGRKGVRFKDVAGLQEAKLEVKEFIDYLKRPEHYKSLGAKVPKGALLLGPPGCGKTLLAKAIATEAEVPFLTMAGSEFVEMIGGLGAARVRDLFKEARKRAPCIVYIDEVDAIGKKRSSTSGGAGLGGQMSGEEEQTLNQLLVEMDGMASREGVLMVASTNRADVLDKALLRPGRFDRHILIDLPTFIERREIFEQHLKDISLKNPPSFYSTRMAQLTPRFSGADIANVCNEAALHAARNKETVVDAHNLEYAVERVVGGTEKRTQVMSPEEKRIVAFHESGHALIGWLLEHTDALLKVSIVPRTTKVLGFAQYMPRDKKLYTAEELFDRMCMALGGRVAESVIFNRITSGAEDDLKKVTKLAYNQVRTFGMNPTVGLVSFTEDADQPFGKKPYSKSLSALIDLEARKLVAKAYQRTEEVMRANQDKLKTIAEALLTKETLNYDDMVNLIGPPPHEKKHLITPAELDAFLQEQSQPEETDAPPEVPKPTEGSAPKPTEFSSCGLVH